MIKQLTCIRASGGEATVDIEHPIGMWPGENTPFLYLRLQRRIRIPIYIRTCEKREERESRPMNGC